MKYKYFYFLTFLVFACKSESHNNKNVLKWNKKIIGRFSVDFPSSYQLKYLSADSNKGLITNGHVNLDFTKAFLVPNTFDGGEIVKEIKNSSLKGKMLFFSNGINKGATVICYWDSTKSTDIFNGSKRYSGLVFITKNINSKEQDTLNKIFNSVSERK
jgi:hypothetical protein